MPGVTLALLHLEYLEKHFEATQTATSLKCMIGIVIHDHESFSTEPRELRATARPGAPAATALFRLSEKESERLSRAVNRCAVSEIGCVVVLGLFSGAVRRTETVTVSPRTGLALPSCQP